MSGFLKSVISVSFLSVICDLVLPKSGMEKYIKLVLGFIMMSVLISPINSDISLNFSDYEFFDMPEEELYAQSDAYILELHKNNIENKVKEICGSDTDVFIDLYSDGLIKSVTISGNDKEKYISRLKEELGCENIKVIEG
ncbi:MAG: stage III sporulation protein AF [Clostridia bacterium]